MIIKLSLPLAAAGVHFFLEKETTSVCFASHSSIKERALATLATLISRFYPALHLTHKTIKIDLL
ncbi:MAG: hypothetical protein ACJATI_003166 [Halioglobus sp.]|jgi:hypothetical protein